MGTKNAMQVVKVFVSVAAVVAAVLLSVFVILAGNCRGAVRIWEASANHRRCIRTACVRLQALVRRPRCTTEVVPQSITLYGVTITT